MAGELIRDLVIPRCEGRAFEVRQGQVLRVIASEGKQVGDMTALGLDDIKEKFSAIMTVMMNDRSFRKAEKLWAGPPSFNVMFTVENDKYGVHWVNGRCTRIMYQARFGVEGHRNCHDNITEALKPFGVAPHDVSLDTFNIFMVVDTDAENHYSFRPPLIEKGDFIDFRAHMDTLVAISACPYEGDVNGGDPKALKVEIREG